MPCVADTQVKIITDGQKQMLDTDSIDSIILWDKRYPDRKYLFKPFRSEIFEYKTEKITGISDSPVWLCCEQVEENASYWVEIGRPSFKKQKIQFNFSSRSYPSVYYVLKKGSEHPSRKPDKTKDVKKWVKVYFNDDPEVMRKFEAGESDASDWGYKYVDVRRIISEYKPQIK